VVCLLAGWLLALTLALTAGGADKSSSTERIACRQLAPVLREVDRIYDRTIIVGGNSDQQQSRQFPPIMRATDRAFQRLARIKVTGEKLPPQVNDLRDALSHRGLWAGLATAWDCASGRSCGPYEDENPLHELGTSLRSTQDRVRAVRKTCTALGD
jgi:hypothetical protein